jgi:hypothetical protein
MVTAKTVREMFKRAAECQGAARNKDKATPTFKAWAREWPMEVAGFLWTGLGAVRRGRLAGGHKPEVYPSMVETCRGYLREAVNVVKPGNLLRESSRFTNEFGRTFVVLGCPTGEAFRGERASERGTYVDAVLWPVLEGYPLYCVGHLGPIYAATTPDEVHAIIMPCRM